MTLKQRLEELCPDNPFHIGQDKEKQEFLTAIEQDILELIGEDVVNEENVAKYAKASAVSGLINIYQDALRRELRTKLHKYIKGDE